METGYKYRDALRLLFVLQHGSEALDTPVATGAVRVFKGEKRLHAIEFWMRYPDYLAEALLDLYDQSKDASLLAEVDAIFANEEPSVRLVKMLRWKRGAFDHIEDALAVLSARRLILPVRTPLPTGKFQHDFFVFKEAADFLDEAVAEQPSLLWYRDRILLAMRVAKLDSGYALKEAQYSNPEYKDAHLGAYIPTIEDRVRARLKLIMGQAA